MCAIIDISKQLSGSERRGAAALCAGLRRRRDDACCRCQIAGRGEVDQIWSSEWISICVTASWTSSTVTLIQSHSVQLGSVCSICFIPRCSTTSSRCVWFLIVLRERSGLTGVRGGQRAAGWLFWLFKALCSHMQQVFSILSQCSSDGVAD